MFKIVIWHIFLSLIEFSEKKRPLVSYVQTLRKIAPNFCGLLRKLYLQSFQRKSPETTFTQGFVSFSAKNGVELFLFSLKICRQICLLHLILCGLEDKSLHLHLISSFSWIYTNFKKFQIWLRCITEEV